jgi:hypothetical protein
MMAYKLCFVGSDGAQMNCITEAASDDECCDVAVGMMETENHKSLEVWRGTLLIYRLTKPESLGPLGT